MMMKYLVLFSILVFCGFSHAFLFEKSSSEEESVIEEISERIDYIYDHFDDIIEGVVLEGQHESMSGPVREFAYCIYNNHSEALKTALLDIASAVIKNESLAEREQLCKPPHTTIVYDLYTCADNIKPSTELSEIFHALVYFPFRAICTYERIIYTPDLKIALTNCTECPEIIMKLSEIIMGHRKPTKEDECLPIKFAKAFRIAFAETAAIPEMESIDFDLIQELVRFYITMQAKLPFASYLDCYQL